MKLINYYLENKATGHIYRLVESTKETYRIIENNHTMQDDAKVLKEYKLLKNAIKYFETMASKPIMIKHINQ